jgi:hypothetical protein
LTDAIFDISSYGTKLSEVSLAILAKMGTQTESSNLSEEPKPPPQVQPSLSHISILLLKPYIRLPSSHYESAQILNLTFDLDFVINTFPDVKTTPPTFVSSIPKKDPPSSPSVEDLVLCTNMEAKITKLELFKEGFAEEAEGPRLWKETIIFPSSLNATLSSIPNKQQFIVIDGGSIDCALSYQDFRLAMQIKDMLLESMKKYADSDDANGKMKIENEPKPIPSSLPPGAESLSVTFKFIGVSLIDDCNPDVQGDVPLIRFYLTV